MPLIALCPYCNRGHVQAADDALGITVRCPECRSDFAFIPSSELVASSGSAESELQTVPPVKKRKKRSVVITGESSAPRPKKKPALRVDALLSEYTPAPAADETFPSIAVVRAAPESIPDAARTPTLIAAILGGLGLAASQIPDYGRLICAVLCLLGLVLAGFALLGAERSRRWPGVVTGVCAVGLFLAVLLPSWLGAAEWWPARTTDDVAGVKAVPRDGSGGQTPASEWVNAESSAWQQGDVRVTLRVEKGRVDLTGPARNTKRTKTEHLRVTVIVLNEGVERAIDFRGWAVPHLPTLTDAAGQTLFPSVFDRGWKANTEPSQKGVLMPGKSTKQAFLYDLPKSLSTLRYELPGEVVGLTAPIRFEIPASSILLRPE